MKFRWYAIILTIICVIVFILQFSYEPLTEEFFLKSSDVLQRPWILVTSMFLHGGVDHLLFNMIALALFGSILEKIIGGKKFLILYFVSGIIASVGSAFFYEASLGASGAIFGILGALGILRPRMTIYMGFIPMPMVVAVFFWGISNFLGLFFPGQIANAAHLGGLFVGLIVGFYWKKDFGEKYIKRKTRSLDERTARTWEDNHL